MEKKPKTRQEKITIAVLCLVIFFTFSYMFSSDDSSKSATQTQEVAYQAPDIDAIQAELDEYAAGRWSFVDTHLVSDYILIRITVKTDIPVNSTATNGYCSIIKGLLSQYAPSHVKTAQVEISQYGEIIKKCEY